MEASRAVLPGQLPKLATIPLKRGAERAFEQLYRKHARDVYQYALAVLTNPADAEDVTQQTFLNAFRAYQRGERPLRPHNWLIAIAHNVCRMRWRQANHRPKEVALDEAPEPAAVHTQDQPDLDEVLQALARLSFNQRAALVMRELEGRSYKEIAKVLGVSVGAVEALLFRARRHLRLQRRALGVLGAAPLPTSLASSFGIGGAATGGGAAIAGGAALGTDLVLKAAALVAVGAMTAGVGYRAVEAARTPEQAAAAFKAQPTRLATPAQHARLASPTRAKAPRATPKAKPTPTSHPTRTLAPPSHNVEQISGGTLTPQPASPTTTPVVTTPPLPVQPPAPPILGVPPVPPLPVTTPKIPLPPIK